MKNLKGFTVSYQDYLRKLKKLKYYFFCFVSSGVHTKVSFLNVFLRA